MGFKFKIFPPIKTHVSELPSLLIIVSFKPLYSSLFVIYDTSYMYG